MSAKKSLEYSTDTYSIASTTASLKSKISRAFKLKKSSGSESEAADADTKSKKPAKGPKINYETTATYLALR